MHSCSVTVYATHICQALYIANPPKDKVSGGFVLYGTSVSDAFYYPITFAVAAPIQLL